MKFEAFNEEYLHRLREGDPVTGDHFAAYFRPLLRLKLRARLRSPQLVEDIVQETFARVLGILCKGGVKSPNQFGAFVNGVCENVAREYCRSEGRVLPFEDNMPEPIDPHADMDAVLVNAHARLSIQKVFAGLSQKDRRILQAVYLDEIGKAEICRMFGINANYLRVLIHRAKAAYRKLYFASLGEKLPES